MQMVAPMTMPMFSNPPREWDTGLFDCFQDIYSCVMGCLAPCVLEGNIVELISSRGMNAWGCDCVIGCIIYSCLLDCIPCPCLCCYTSGKRTQIRAMHNLRSTTGGDFCLHYWCLPCAQCQEYRQLLIPIQVPILVAPAAAPAPTTIVINNSNENSNNVSNNAQLNNNNNIGVGGGDRGGVGNTMHDHSGQNNSSNAQAYQSAPQSPNHGPYQSGGYGPPPPMGNYNPPGGYNNPPPGNYNPQYPPQGYPPSNYQLPPQQQQQQQHQQQQYPYGGYPQQQQPQMSPGAQQQPMGGPPCFAPQNYMQPPPPGTPTNQQMAPPGFVPQASPNGYPPAQQWGQIPQAYATPPPQTDAPFQQREVQEMPAGGAPLMQMPPQSVGTAPEKAEQ